MEKNGGIALPTGAKIHLSEKKIVVRDTVIVNNARSAGGSKVFGHFGILKRGSQL